MCVAVDQQRLWLCLQLSERRVPREGCPILLGEEQVGTITSGTFSPTLQVPIAMGLVKPGNVVVGDTLEVDIRGRRIPANVVEVPFYKRT